MDRFIIICLLMLTATAAAQPGGTAFDVFFTVPPSESQGIRYAGHISRYQGKSGEVEKVYSNLSGVPLALTFDSMSGDMYFAQKTKDSPFTIALYRNGIQLGQLLELGSAQTAPWPFDLDLAMGPDGHLYYGLPPIEEGQDGQIRRFNVSEKSSEAVYQNLKGSPSGIAFDSLGRLCFGLIPQDTPWKLNLYRENQFLITLIDGEGYVLEDQALWQDFFTGPYGFLYYTHPPLRRYRSGTRLVETVRLASVNRYDPETGMNQEVYRELDGLVRGMVTDYAGRWYFSLRKDAGTWEVKLFENGQEQALIVDGLGHWFPVMTGPGLAVRPLDGEPAPARYPTPPDETPDVSASPFLSWSFCVHTESYYLHCWPQGDPAPKEPSSPYLWETQYGELDLTSGRPYYWRVFSTNQGKQTQSPTWAFYTKPFYQPDFPADPEPPTGSRHVSVEPCLSWSPCEGAAEYALYWWRDGEDRPEEPLIIAAETDYPQEESCYHQFQSPLEAQSLYYWQVDARDNRANYTRGPLWRFTTGEVLPEIPASPYPAQGAQEVGRDVTLRWAETLRAETYYLSLWPAEESPPDGPTVSYLTETFYRPNSLLARGETYNWQVGACNSEGWTPGPLWRFTVEEAIRPDVKDFGYDQGWRKGQHPRMVADVNGDGKDDIIGFGDQGVMVALSESSPTGPVLFSESAFWAMDFGSEKGWTVENHPRMVADVNGDGMADLLGFGDQGVMAALSMGFRFENPAFWVEDYGLRKGWEPSRHIRELADVSGDGLPDLVGFGDRGIMVSLSLGYTFSAPAMWAWDFGYNQYWRVETHPRSLADVNGDGRADVLGFGDYGVMVALAGEETFLPSSFWVENFGTHQDWDCQRHLRLTGDINGDDLGDLVGFGNPGVWVALGEGTAFAPAELMLEDLGFDQYWMPDRYPRILLDMNGDNRDDVLGFGAAGTVLSLSLGTELGQPETWVEEFGEEQGWSARRHLRLTGDVDGDGLPDIIGFHDGGVIIY